MSLAALIHRSSMSKKEQAAAGTLIWSETLDWSDFDYCQLTELRSTDGDNGTFLVDRDVSGFIGTNTTVGVVPIVDSVGPTIMYNAQSRASLVEGTNVISVINGAFRTSQAVIDNTIVSVVKTYTQPDGFIQLTDEAVEYRLDINGYTPFGRAALSASPFSSDVKITSPVNAVYKSNQSLWFSLRKDSNKIEVIIHRDKVSDAWNCSTLTTSDYDNSTETVVSIDIWNNYQPHFVFQRVFGPTEFKLYQL